MTDPFGEIDDPRATTESIANCPECGRFAKIIRIVNDPAPTGDVRVVMRCRVHGEVSAA